MVLKIDVIIVNPKEIAKDSATDFPTLIVRTAIWRHPCDIPHNEAEILPIIQNLENLYEKNKNYIVAIWECWIDLHFPDNPPLQAQQYALKLQAKKKKKLNLPLMIHSRDGLNETIEVLKEFSDLKIYFHARWYGTNELQECEEIFPNLRIGCTNVIEYPNAKKIREAITNIKFAKILTETDAPFLPPQNMRGQQNEPAYVNYVYEKLCEILSINEINLKQIIKENTKSLYSI